MFSPRTTFRTLRPALAMLALTMLLTGRGTLGDPGPPHPGAVNPYSNGGFHDAGPNYPNTGI